MKTYIVGPMSGLPEFNYPAFRAAAKALREKGYSVLSPHEEHAERGQEWRYYMRRGLVMMLERCDAIALLPGWEISKGATLEHAVAEALGYAVYDVVDGELVAHEVTT